MQGIQSTPHGKFKNPFSQWYKVDVFLFFFFSFFFFLWGLWIVFLVWVALFFVIPTDLGSELYADWIGATNESLFRYSGSYFLIQPFSSSCCWYELHWNEEEGEKCVKCHRRPWLWERGKGISSAQAAGWFYWRWWWPFSYGTVHIYIEANSIIIFNCKVHS